jgi:chaperonin GroES
MLQVEKVVEVLKPGPLGIKEHKYSDAELQAARTVADKARENWSRISKQR